MNSGSRYIVPIDWIFYFYYGLTLTCILQWVTNLLRGSEQKIIASFGSQPFTDMYDKKRLWQTLGALIVIASLVPIANVLVPALYNYPSQHTNQEKLSTSIPISQQNGATIAIGEVLYPYYNKNSVFEFDLLSNQGAKSYSIQLEKQPLEVTLWGGETILVGWQKHGSRRDVKFIYLQEGTSLKLIWENHG